MIVFDDVNFSYGERQVLDKVSFSLNAEERVALLGGSGVGKTTILKLILGLLRPSSGRIIIEGEDISNKSESNLGSVRRKFSIVFQEGALFDSLNVKENVAFFLREYSAMTEEQIEDNVRSMLKVVDLESAINLMPEELSGGMRQRVAIARSLAASKPRMFFYDEPMSQLDPINAGKIRQLILHLAQGGRGFIVVSHEVADAVKICSRFLFFEASHLIFDGQKNDFLRSAIPTIREYLSDFFSLRNNQAANLLNGNGR